MKPSGSRPKPSGSGRVIDDAAAERASGRVGGCDGSLLVEGALSISLIFLSIPHPWNSDVSVRGSFLHRLPAHHLGGQSHDAPCSRCAVVCCVCFLCSSSWGVQSALQTPSPQEHLGMGIVMERCASPFRCESVGEPASGSVVVRSKRWKAEPIWCARRPGPGSTAFLAMKIRKLIARPMSATEFSPGLTRQLACRADPQHRGRWSIEPSGTCRSIPPSCNSPIECILEPSRSCTSSPAGRCV